MSETARTLILLAGRVVGDPVPLGGGADGGEMLTLEAGNGKKLWAIFRPPGRPKLFDRVGDGSVAAIVGSFDSNRPSSRGLAGPVLAESILALLPDGVIAAAPAQPLDDAA